MVTRFFRWMIDENLEDFKTINFISLHYIYITSCTLILWGILADKIHKKVDTFFLAASCSTGTGLTTFDVNETRIKQQAGLFAFTWLTKPTMISLFVLAIRLLRLKILINKLSALLEEQAPSVPEETHTTTAQEGHNSEEGRMPAPEVPRDSENDRGLAWTENASTAVELDVIAEDSSIRRSAVPVPTDGQEPVRKLSIAEQMTVRAERAKLQKVYRAGKRLLKIKLVYEIVAFASGFAGLASWIKSPSNPEYRDYLASLGINLVWWAAYTTTTMLSNYGLTLTPDSLISFRTAALPIAILTVLGVFGNTLYPISVRFMIWALFKLSKDKEAQEEYRLLLDSSRQFDTLVFPSAITWILLAFLIVQNIVDVLLIFFLDADTEELKGLPLGERIGAVIFQAVSTRQAGTATLNIAGLNVGLLMLFMMFISALPIAMSIRSSNLFEDVVRPSGDSATEQTHPNLEENLVKQQGHDLWPLVAAYTLLVTTEFFQHQTHDQLSMIFECVSAYTSVGLSLGTKTGLASFSSVLMTSGKLIIISLMFRGRHRALPDAKDPAVMLPQFEDNVQKILERYHGSAV